MSRTVFVRGLWICTIAIVATAAFQALSGHWVAFFLFWPGFPSLENYLGLLNTLASLHRVFGVITGVLSIATLVFALLSKPGLIVRICAIVGLVMVGLAVLGGYLYVTSVFQDRWSLGQMADAFVGVFGAYFIQLIFMVANYYGRRVAANRERQ